MIRISLDSMAWTGAIPWQKGQLYVAGDSDFSNVRRGNVSSRPTHAPIWTMKRCIGARLRWRLVDHTTSPCHVRWVGR